VLRNTLAGSKTWFLCAGTLLYANDENLNYHHSRISLDLSSLQGLSIDTNIDSSSFIPDPTSLYDMSVGELFKEDLGNRPNHVTILNIAGTTPPICPFGAGTILVQNISH